MPIELEGARHFEADDYGPVFVAGQRARYERGLYDARCRWLQRYLHRVPCRGQQWIDAGVGIGVFAAELHAHGAQVLGFDFSPAVLAAARERAPDAVLFRGSLEHFALRAQSTDGILALDVLEHLVQPQIMLREIARVLRPGGRLILSTDNARTPSRWRGVRRLAHWMRQRTSAHAELERIRREFPAPSNHVRLYTPREVQAMLRKAGFRVLRWDSFPRQASPRVAALLATRYAAVIARGIRGGELILEAERLR